MYALQKMYALEKIVFVTKNARHTKKIRTREKKVRVIKMYVLENTFAFLIKKRLKRKTQY